MGLMRGSNVFLDRFLFFLESIYQNSAKGACARAYPGLAKSPSVAGRPHRSFQTAAHLAHLSRVRSSVVSSILTTIS